MDCKKYGQVWIYDRSGAPGKLRALSGRPAYFVGWEKTEAGIKVLLTNRKWHEVEATDIKWYPQNNIKEIEGQSLVEQYTPKEKPLVVDESPEHCVLCQTPEPDIVKVVCGKCQVKLRSMSAEDITKAYKKAMKAGLGIRSSIYRSALNDIPLADRISDEVFGGAEVINLESIKREKNDEKARKFKSSPIRNETLSMVESPLQRENWGK